MQCQKSCADCLLACGRAVTVNVIIGGQLASIGAFWLVGESAGRVLLGEARCSRGFFPKDFSKFRKRSVTPSVCSVRLRHNSVWVGVSCTMSRTLRAHQRSTRGVSCESFRE